MRPASPPSCLSIHSLASGLVPGWPGDLVVPTGWLMDTCPAWPESPPQVHSWYVASCLGGLSEARGGWQGLRMTEGTLQPHKGSPLNRKAEKSSLLGPLTWICNSLPPQRLQGGQAPCSPHAFLPACLPHVSGSGPDNGWDARTSLIAHLHAWTPAVPGPRHLHLGLSPTFLCFTPLAPLPSLQPYPSSLSLLSVTI
jgi:hypothetical protein